MILKNMDNIDQVRDEAFTCFKRSHTRESDGRILVWDVERLWRLSQEISPMPKLVEGFTEFDENMWFTDTRVTVKEVVKHTERINNCDLSFPIILNADGQIMDGVHRLAKAYILGHEKINVVQFSETHSPDRIFCFH